MGCLRFNAQYDPSIQVNAFKLAIERGDKENFVQLFESLPLGIVGSINQGEDLHGFPELAKRNSEKKTFTPIDLAQLRQYMKDTNFSGVICLSDSKSTYTLSSSNQLNGDTPFAMHSIGKMFTGMLAIKLIENGVIPITSLDEPIQLDAKTMDMLGPAVKEHLTKSGAPTFRQIMQHQGGLGDYLNKYEEAIQKGPIPKIETPEDFIQFADDEIKEGKHYSNLGLLLTGLSIQHHYNAKGEKKTYQEILEEFVLKPAGISSFSLSKPEGGCYNELHPAAAHIQGGPAGGYWISPKDLLKFGEWTAKQCEDPSFHGLVKEYGGEFQPDPGELSHGGQIDSATSFLGTFLPDGITIAILSNRPDQAAVLEGAIKNHLLK